MNKILKKRNTIYGVLAIWIVLFHVFRRISMPYIWGITNVIGIGNMAVDVFFFLSGLCLSLSEKKNKYSEKGWKEYANKRLSRILLPYLMIGLPYYVWKVIFEYSGVLYKRVLLFFADISSVTFWIYGTLTTWYVFGIVVFYILFPFMFLTFTKSNWFRRSILILGFVLFSVFAAYCPIVENSLILWARLPIFALGIIAGIEYDKIKEPKIFEVICEFIILVLLGWLISTSEISETFELPPVLRFLLYMPMTLALMRIMSVVGKRYSFFEWIGSMSLEIYLVHIVLLHPIDYYGLINKLGYWLYIVLPVLSVLVSYIVSRCENLILRKQGV